MDSTTNNNNGLKIGYMPLAHEAYWKFFPEHQNGAMKLADEFRKYLSQFGTVCDIGKLIDSQKSSHEARLHFQKEDVDVFVLATVTYSTPDDVLIDLKRFSRPTILWNTQASSSIPSDMNFDKWMFEHGITGVPGLTNLLEREEIPYFLVSGHHTADKVNESFTTIKKALQAFKAVWGARIGIFGHLYPGMLDFGYDPALMYTTFGASTVPILESAVLEAYKTVPLEDASALKDSLGAKYSIADTFEGEELIRSARLALAMKQVVKEFDLDAASVYCQSMWQNPEIGVVSCIGNSMLAKEGIFCSCEGDIPTALCGLILNSLCGKAVFTEIWCNDFDNDSFMMGHSGQMNLALFEDNPKSVQLCRHPWWNGCHGRGACLQLKMPAGEATMLSVNPSPDGHWRMVVAVEDVTDRNPVPLGAPNFFIQLRQPISEFLDNLGSSGSAHHFALGYGNWTPHLKALSRILNLEYIEI